MSENEPLRQHQELEQYLKDDPEDLDVEDRELLYVVAKHPKATLEEIGEVYGFASGSPISSELLDILDIADNQLSGNVVPPMFGDGEDALFEDEPPNDLAEEIVAELDKQRDGDDEGEETREDEAGEGEPATDDSLDEPSTLLVETLKGVCRYPMANQRELGDVLGVSRGAVEQRVHKLRNRYDFDWDTRDEDAVEILEEFDKGVPSEADEEFSYGCPNAVCDRTFDTKAGLAAHQRTCGDTTPRQNEVLETIRENPHAKQYEIAEMLDISNSAVSKILVDQLGYGWHERQRAVEERLGEGGGGDEGEDSLESRVAELETRVDRLEQGVED